MMSTRTRKSPKTLSSATASAPALPVCLSPRAFPIGEGFTEELLHSIIDNTLGFISVFDLDGTMVETNHVPLLRGGLTRDDVIGKKFWDCYWWNYAPEPMARLRQAMAKARDGERVRYDARVRMAGGEFIMIDFALMPVFDQAGCVQYLVSSGVDITERVRAEEALRVSETRFRELANSMPQLVWTAEPDGSIDYINDKHEPYSTIRRTDGIYDWAPALHPDDIACTEKAWAKALRTGKPYSVEHRVALKEGGYRWLLSRGIPARDESGQVVKWYGTSTDIHMLKEAARLKDEFMAVASHELRTPVTSIKAYAQVLEHRFKKAGDTTSAALVAKIDTQLDKLGMLIADTLDATRIEQGKLRLRPTTFDVNTLVREVAEDVERGSLTHHVELSLQRSCALHADRERIGQVLTNLLTNAIKYSPNKEVVRVHAECGKVDGERRVLIRVEDDGLGIHPEDVGHVFERFFRASGDDHDTYPGLGLGLYISRELVERHHGRIWVDSALGRGSTFYVSLPCAHRPDTKALTDNTS